MPIFMYYTILYTLFFKLFAKFSSIACGMPVLTAHLLSNTSILFSRTAADLSEHSI